MKICKLWNPICITVFMRLVGWLVCETGLQDEVHRTCFSDILWAFDANQSVHVYTNNGRSNSRLYTHRTLTVNLSLYIKYMYVSIFYWWLIMRENVQNVACICVKVKYCFLMSKQSVLLLWILSLLWVSIIWFI